VSAIRAIQGKTDDAVRLLGQAIAGGFTRYLPLEHDPSFDSLRDNPEFLGHLSDLRDRAVSIRREVRGGGDFDQNLVSIFL
jgi:hypothetical protein